jgi:hypothetical protein
LTTDHFFEEGTRLLTPHAFDFVLDGELKQGGATQLSDAGREARCVPYGMTVTADEGTVGEVARIVGHEVRDTDLIDHGKWHAALVPDADYENPPVTTASQCIDSYDFPTPLRIRQRRLLPDACDRRHFKRQASRGPSSAGRRSTRIRHATLTWIVVETLPGPAS